FFCASLRQLAKRAQGPHGAVRLVRERVKVNEVRGRRIELALRKVAGQEPPFDASRGALPSALGQKGARRGVPQVLEAAGMIEREFERIQIILEAEYFERPRERRR